MNTIMALVFNYWLCFAFVFSGIWGIYGWNHVLGDSKVEKTGLFVSEFIGSFAGWCCFHILTVRLHPPYSTLESADIFLATGAVVGMAGYSYRIVEFINSKAKSK